MRPSQSGKIALKLKEVLMTRKLSDLTVIEFCNIIESSRQNFYYYFDSLEDCLVFLLLRDSPINAEGILNVKDQISNTLDYLTENKKFLSSLISDNKSNHIVLNFFKEAIAAIIRKFCSDNIENINELEVEDYNFIVSYYSRAFMTPIIAFLQDEKAIDIRENTAKFAYFINGDINRSVNKLLDFYSLSKRS